MVSRTGLHASVVKDDFKDENQVKTFVVINILLGT